MVTIVSLGFLIIGLLAFANGANDISRATATLVGSGLSGYRNALRWAVGWTLLGSLLSGVMAENMARRFVQSLSPVLHHGPGPVYACVAGAFLWVLFATWRSLPVSTTHALFGSLLAIEWLVAGASPGTQPGIWQNFIAPLLSSPLISLAVVVAALRLSHNLRITANGR